MGAVDEACLKVWARQPKRFFERATIDMDGTLVVTTGECKGRDGHLVQRNLGLPSAVGLVGRDRRGAPPGQPLGESSQSRRAAEEADQVIALCRRAGCKIVLRGDTAFSQSERLDAWDDDGVTSSTSASVALENLEDIADNLPKSEWQKLLRPPRYEIQKPIRGKKPVHVKGRIVLRREVRGSHPPGRRLRRVRVPADGL